MDTKTEETVCPAVGQQGFLNRDAIKYMAMFTMFLNHFATVFLQPGTLLFELFINIGYFTAVTMCYFLVEGYEYTHSKRKYALRLLLFAVISQVPYVAALEYFQLNMLFTLLFCYLILAVREKVQDAALRTILITGLVLLTVFCDWALLAAVYTLLFSINRGSRRGTAISYGVAFFMFAGLNMLNYVGIYSTWEAVLGGLLSGAAILVSGIVILFCYNGKQAKGNRKFHKWFFYIFYPAHLTLFAVIKLLIM